METSKKGDAFRRVRSFVIREGRFTPSQRRNLELHWQEYGIEPDGDVVDAFEARQPLVVEVGFGMGDSLLASAQAEPDLNFLGIEVHRPGVGHLLGLVADAGLKNLRVANTDAYEVLGRFAQNSLFRVQVFFPDPWPKKKHHKRRLIGPRFLDLVAPRLACNGILHIVTDWAGYAEHIAETLAQWPMFEATVAPSRTETKYERRGIRLGHGIHEFAFRLVPKPAE